MRSYRLAWTAAAAVLLALAASPARAQTGRICPSPSRPCAGFKPHDLSFVLPSDGRARAQSVSEQFYAVILRSGRACSIREPQRLSVQRYFRSRKVFSQRFECGDDVENNVYYTNLQSRHVAMLAVYAGTTRADADELLATIQRHGAYPDANIRRMQVVYNYP